ncbi:transposase [Bradyrhizobium sp. Arg62]|nr:transposase [Bradyrhizobium brasilense]
MSNGRTSTSVVYEERQAPEFVVSSGRSITAVGKELSLRAALGGEAAAGAGTGDAAPHYARDADAGGPGCRERPFAVENERLRVERDISKESIAIFAGTHELPLNRRPSRYLPGATDVRRARGLAGLAAIRQVHQDSGRRHGSPRVHAALRAQGRGASRGRIERLMRRHGTRAIMASRAPRSDRRRPPWPSDCLCAVL